MRTSKSPLRTQAFNPTNLPLPSKELDPKFVPNRKIGKGRFETPQTAREEDRSRAKRLQRSNKKAVQELGLWLESATAARELPLSLASSVYCRNVRRRLPGAVHGYLCRNFDDVAVLPFTLIHPKWCVKSGDLHKVSARNIKAQLRNLLVVLGVEAAEGFLFAALHGEFDGKAYQLHFHGIAMGEKVHALRNALRRTDLMPSASVYRHFQVEKAIDLSETADFVRWFTYCIKSYWPYRPTYSDADGKLCRTRRAQRLPAEQEAEVLAWLGRQNFGETVVLSGLRLRDLRT